MNPLVAKKQVDAILDQNLAVGLIQHSNSPYSSPIVAIPKKSGGIRITVNYRKLNSISTLGQLPIPRVEEILAKLNRGSIFSLFRFTSFLGHAKGIVTERVRWVAGLSYLRRRCHR